MISTKNIVIDINNVPSYWIFEYFLNLPEKLTGQDIKIKSIETRTRTFKVNDNANHLVRFCCDECLNKSALKIAPVTASGAVA